MNYKQKITLILFLLIFIWSFFISWIYWITSLVFSLAFYSIILYFIIYSFKKLKIKNLQIFNYLNYKIFLKNFLYRVSILITLLIIIIWWFAYYQNEISPAKMPIYYLSNWEKNLVFYSMSHIGTKSFYEWVRNKIIEKKEKDYVLFFEWVRPWSIENHEKFNKAIWVEFDEKLYENFSKLYWLVHQDNNMFLWLVNNLDFNIDVSLDDIIQYYEEKKELENKTSREYSSPINISDQILSQVSLLRENELRLLRYINKAFISIIIKSENLQNTIKNNFWNKELFSVILDKRDKVIAEEIIKSEYQNIIATYWLLHFMWIFELLKKNDIRWQIKKIEYTYPLKN